MPEQPVSHGPWTILRSREVYRDPWIALRRDEVMRPDGEPGSHCVLHLKPGVSVLALDEDGTVYLTDEFHYAIGRNSLEAVSGGIEAGEEPQQAARRELEEEIGLVAAEWLELGTVDPFTSIVVSPTRLFLARQLQPGTRAPEGTEQIRTVQVSLDEARRMVEAG